MASVEGRILACRQDDRVVFRVVGRATACSCPELRKFAEHCFEEGVNRVGVDLGECTHFDSTFVGTLLFLKRRSSGRDGSQFALTAASPESQQLLRRMTVAQLFQVATDDQPCREMQWTELRGELNPQRTFDFKRNVADAHQELAQVNSCLAEQFKAVADACARELEGDESRSP